jgi:hypothetical protein
MSENLFTLLGQAQAYVNIFEEVRLHPRTEAYYQRIYDSFICGILSPDAVPSRTAAVAWRSAIRHGALRRLRSAAAAMEAAMESGDWPNACAAAVEVEECLAQLHRFPAARAGRRPRLERLLVSADADRARRAV